MAIRSRSTPKPTASTSPFPPMNSPAAARHSKPRLTNTPAARFTSTSRTSKPRATAASRMSRGPRAYAPEMSPAGYNWADRRNYMSSAEILEKALTLPEHDRARLIHSLIQSFPPSPRVFSSEEELGQELQRRIEETKSGAAATFDAADTMRRA